MPETTILEREPNEPNGKRGPIVGKIGVGLILLSGVFFFTMLGVPFMPLGNGMKVFLGGSLFVGVQVAWWVGAAMAGPVVVAKIYSLFKRKKKNADSNELENPSSAEADEGNGD